MSGVFPSSSLIATESLESANLTYRVRTPSGNSVAVRQVGHFWRWQCETIPMSRADWQLLFAFHNQQRGRYNTFTYTPVSMRTPLGGLAGSTYSVSVATSSAAVGNTSIDMSGFPNSTVVFKAGDFFKFAGHNKVYAVESTSVTSSTAGAGTVTFYPELVTAASSTESITYQNVPFTVCFAEDGLSLPVAVTGFVVASIKMEEVWNG